MAMILLVFKLHPDEQDARASIPVTVLLTLVFLQQAYRGELPSLPFLTYIDQVYVVAYFVTFVAFVLVLWMGRRDAEIEAMEDESERHRMQQRLKRLDDSWPMVVLGFASSALIAAWLLIPASG